MHLVWLQVECEHQLGLERERTAAAIKQRDAAEARTAALESQFTEYVTAQRNAPESQLKAELADAQRAAEAAEQKLGAAMKLKQKYKQQVGAACCMAVDQLAISWSAANACSHHGKLSS